MRTDRPRAAGAVLLALALLGLVGCGTDGEARRGDAPSQDTGFVPPAGTARDPGLEEAAALLCARDTHALIDDDARRAGRIWEGQVAALLERGDEEAALVRRVSGRADALVAETGATHFGFATGLTLAGEPCAAVVVTRRQLTLETPLPGHLDEAAPFPLAFTAASEGARADVFLATPAGSVERTALEPGRAQTVIDPRAGHGRYVLEVIVHDDERGPEVALLWPFTVGSGKLAPAPAVLFPDEGHSDAGLTRRLEALVHRLRIEQQLKPLAIAPPLGRLATARAAALAGEGRLGHHLPDDTDALSALRAREPGFPVTSLAEVQAQAGTLDEAWTALLDSPAHRYELVGTRASHIGAGVVRGEDGLGRPLVSVVLLLARRILVRPVDDVRTELYGRLNLARDVTGAKPLKRDGRLEEVATRLATAMAERGVLDEGALGTPASELALAAHPGLDEVRVVVARVDDPLRLSPSGATLDGDATVLGVGLVPPDVAGQWYVALVVGTP